MSYHMCFESRCDGRLHLEVVYDDINFADAVAAALRAHPAKPPAKEPQLSNALQGNLCEFCVWDIGEGFWHIYEREWTWTTNASSPWRPSSDPGIDILALAGDEPSVLVIEVKSSSSGGSGSITGDGSSLQTDFRHLFSSDDYSRLQNRLGTVISDLILKAKRSDLAEKVANAVGKGPGSSQGVRLVGVLICRRGNLQSQSTRLDSFRELQAWLLEQGWRDGQIECRCIEVQDFSCWLSEVIRRAVCVHA
jgi:hypothetical protein